MAKSKIAAAEASVAADALPLFFKRPATLDSVRHQDAGLRAKADLSFARQCNSVPLNAVEFIEASHHYPIVFTSEAQPVPVAVLGWEQKNHYVTDENLWREGCYVPAYVRQYPFILFEAPNSDSLYLCVDEAAPNYVGEGATGGEDMLPFYVEGQASPASTRALEFANAFLQHMKITRHFCEDLMQHGLLMPYNASATIGGVQKQLNNFLIIDETAFNALSDEVFLEFRRKGWLGLVYLSLASLANWKAMR